MKTKFKILYGFAIFFFLLSCISTVLFFGTLLYMFIVDVSQMLINIAIMTGFGTFVAYCIFRILDLCLPENFQIDPEENKKLN